MSMYQGVWRGRFGQRQIRQNLVSHCKEFLSYSKCDVKSLGDFKRGNDKCGG